MQGEAAEAELMACHCCGQQRPYPTREGLWEYVHDPLFNPDGTLVTEFRGEDIISFQDGKPVDPPIHIKRVRPCYQPWQRASVVDASKAEHGREDYTLLLVPAGKKIAIWWPERALWRKVGDKPEIDWREVVADGVRLGDGERVCEEEDE